MEGEVVLNLGWNCICFNMSLRNNLYNTQNIHIDYNLFTIIIIQENQ